MNELVQMITTVGFPIVACLGMGWYVKYTTDINNAEMKEMRKEHMEEITRITDAINNNTLALQKLADKIDMESGDD